MLSPIRWLAATLGAASVLTLLGACAAHGPGAGRPVVIGAGGPQLVALWDEVADATIAGPPSPTGQTPEERRPGPDIATVHVAIYDAVIAIVGTHAPFVARPSTPVAGASVEAAASEAAYRVLKGLFPSRSERYQASYERALAAVPAGDAKRRGVAVGAEVAAAVLKWRADDGRSVNLAPYQGGSGPGRFNGVNPVNRSAPYIRPFALKDYAQVRPPGPSALDGAIYARDFAEVASLGGVASTVRTPLQLEVARFHTENPGTLWPRNLRRFAASQPTIAENARLMAMLWVSYNEAIQACFDAKYHFNAWRPQVAIPQADSDGNPATVADRDWKPALPTPNHPEYPAAHGCASGAVAGTLQSYFDTSTIAFEMDSKATGSTHRFDSTPAFLDELRNARVWGGMHFRQSMIDGQALGREVARRVATEHFRLSALH